jgi:orotate phosphoribosyltransferase
MTQGLILPTLPLEGLEDSLLSSQLKEGEKIFANGTPANNHLDMGYEEVPERLRPFIVRGLDLLLEDAGVSRPDFIATVPSGADGWGIAMKQRMERGLEYSPAWLNFHKAERRVFENTAETSALIEILNLSRGVPKGVVLDDASSDGGTAEALADHLTEQGLSISLIEVIVFRGLASQLQSKYLRAALLYRPIPYRMDWKRYRATGHITGLDKQ